MLSGNVNPPVTPNVQVDADPVAGDAIMVTLPVPVLLTNWLGILKAPLTLLNEAEYVPANSVLLVAKDPVDIHVAVVPLLDNI